MYFPCIRCRIVLCLYESYEPFYLRFQVFFLIKGTFHSGSFCVLHIVSTPILTFPQYRSVVLSPSPKARCFHLLLNLRFHRWLKQGDLYGTAGIETMMAKRAANRNLWFFGLFSSSCLLIGDWFIPDFFRSTILSLMFLTSSFAVWLCKGVDRYLFYRKPVQIM